MSYSAKVKPKNCRECGKSFLPYNPLQVVCEWACAIEYNRKKAINDKVEKFKQNLKGHGYYTQTLQAVFNTFIRLRDKGRPCICCDKPLSDKYHAGHFFSTGAFPGLRFDEDNCHGQREDCNLHKHGNSAEYALNLPKRIGEERFLALYDRRKNLSKLSIPDIQDKITHYKEKIEQLKITQK